MAHNESWDDFIAKLDNSPRGRRECSVGGILEAITRPVITNPQTEKDVTKAVAEANHVAATTAVRCGDAVQFINFKED